MEIRLDPLDTQAARYSVNTVRDQESFAKPAILLILVPVHEQLSWHNLDVLGALDQIRRSTALAMPSVKAARMRRSAVM